MHPSAVKQTLSTALFSLQMQVEMLTYDAWSMRTRPSNRDRDGGDLRDSRNNPWQYSVVMVLGPA